MKCTIAVDKGRARKASLQLSLTTLTRFEPPHTELNLSVEDARGTLGSLVLNCIDLGALVAPDSLFGKSFVFDSTDSDSNTELADSVFVAAGENTHELSRIELRFGHLDGKWLPLEIDVSCYCPPDSTEVRVRVRALLATEA